MLAKAKPIGSKCVSIARCKGISSGSAAVQTGVQHYVEITKLISASIMVQIIMVTRLYYYHLCNRTLLTETIAQAGQTNNLLTSLRNHLKAKLKKLIKDNSY